MYCTNCGNRIPDDSAFCPYCGLPTSGRTPPQPASVGAQPPVSPARRRPPAGALVAAVVVVGALAAALAIGLRPHPQPPVGGSGGTSISNSASSGTTDIGNGSPSTANSNSADGVSSSPAEGASSSASTEPEAAEFSTDGFLITYPAGLADDGVSWTAEGDTIELRGADHTPIARVLWGEALEYEHWDCKLQALSIGDVDAGGVTGPVELDVYYVDSEGELIHWGSDKTGTLASELYLGVSPQEIVSWIQLAQGDSFVRAEVTDVYDSNDDSNSN